MPDPVTFVSATPRFGLPLLFTGQAQKEFFVNQAHALADALVHCVVEGVASSPPADPAEGNCWIVGAGATGEWQGPAGRIACRQAGAWLMVDPVDGMRVHDRAAGRQAVYRNGWQRAAAVPLPTGGAVADAEARAAIAGLVAALVAAGILQA